MKPKLHPVPHGTRGSSEKTRRWPAVNIVSANTGEVSSHARGDPVLSAGNHSSPQTSPFLGLSCMESLAIGMGLFGSFGSPEDAEVPRWEQAQVAPRGEGRLQPRWLPQGSHSNAEVEQGKALTADVPEVEAFDNLGGDKKGERFQTALGTTCIRRGGSIKLHARYQRDQGIWQQTLQAMINQAPN